jgi:hypothetical protein
VDHSPIQVYVIPRGLAKLGGALAKAQTREGGHDEHSAAAKAPLTRGSHIS